MTRKACLTSSRKRWPSGRWTRSWSTISPPRLPRGNSRNGYGCRTVITDNGPLPLDIPRDRDDGLEPPLIAKHQRCLPGFDDKVVSMYARGMSTRKIVGSLREFYSTEVCPT